MKTEENLVFLCFKGYLNEDENKEVNNLLNKKINWEYLFKISAINKVFDNVFKCLENEIPEENKKKFRDLEKIIVKFNKKHMLAFETVLPSILKYNNIILLKGISFAYTLYKKKRTKPIGDIDLFIDRPVYSTYAGIFLDHCGVPYDVKSKWPYLEYHHNLNLYQGMNFANMDLNEFWKNAKKININNYSVGILKPEDNLIYLSYRYLTKRFGQLYRFVNLYNLINNNNINWHLLIKNAKKYRLNSSLWINLYLLNKIYNIVPNSVIKSIQPNKIKRVLTFWLIKEDLFFYNPLKIGKLSRIKNRLMIKILLLNRYNFYKMPFSELLIILLGLYKKIFKFKKIGYIVTYLEFRLLSLIKRSKFNFKEMIEYMHGKN
ncbi:hypothetical protein GF361_04770 [Candidatus Woesearchaeota archaeon]|nr:hypothetical protein [Candidatus Woesearchaeota archaeon]